MEAEEAREVEAEAPDPVEAISLTDTIREEDEERQDDIPREDAA